ncbi:MAG: hypothetical protein QM662_11560 [Gordonia sp. (in: high G+C Gram-positive bacteria)]
MSEHTPVSATRRPGPAAVFLDVENLFKPFWRDRDRKSANTEKRHLTAHRAARRAARIMVPDRDFQEVRTLGPDVAKRLVQWFEHNGFTVAENHGRTYGQFYDDGVNAVWNTFVDTMNWNHTLTKKGDDRADRALVTDVRQLLAGQPSVEWVFVGSSDFRSVLPESAQALTGRPEIHGAAILAARTDATDKHFDPVTRRSAVLRRFGTRLYLWAMYTEVLHIEKNRQADPPRRPRDSPAPTATGQAGDVDPAHAERIRAQQQQKHRDRVELVRTWSACATDHEVAEAISGRIGKIGSIEPLNTATTRFLTAAEEIADPTQRERLRRLIVIAQQRRQDQLR